MAHPTLAVVQWVIQALIAGLSMPSLLPRQPPLPAVSSHSHLLPPPLASWLFRHHQSRQHHQEWPHSKCFMTRRSLSPTREATPLHCKSPTTIQLRLFRLDPSPVANPMHFVRFDYFSFCWKRSSIFFPNSFILKTFLVMLITRLAMVPSSKSLLMEVTRYWARRLTETQSALMSGEQLCFHTGRMLTAEHLTTSSSYKLYNMNLNFSLEYKYIKKKIQSCKI